MDISGMFASSAFCWIPDRYHSGRRRETTAGRLLGAPVYLWLISRTAQHITGRLVCPESYHRLTGANPVSGNHQRAERHAPDHRQRQSPRFSRWFLGRPALRMGCGNERDGERWKAGG